MTSLAKEVERRARNRVLNEVLNEKLSGKYTKNRRIVGTYREAEKEAFSEVMAGKHDDRIVAAIKDIDRNSVKATT